MDNLKPELPTWDGSRRRGTLPFTKDNDPTGNKDWRLAGLPHAVGCQCSAKRRAIYDDFLRLGSQKKVAALHGVTGPAVHQHINRTIACKTRAYYLSVSIDKAKASYLHDFLSRANVGVHAHP